MSGVVLGTAGGFHTLAVTRNIVDDPAIAQLNKQIAEIEEQVLEQEDLGRQLVAKQLQVKIAELQEEKRATTAALECPQHEVFEVQH